MVKKYRCTFGRKKGRIVTNPSVCSAPLDIKKRFTLKKTRASMGPRIIRKALRTKRFNPKPKTCSTNEQSIKKKVNTDMSLKDDILNTIDDPKAFTNPS